MTESIDLKRIFKKRKINYKEFFGFAKDKKERYELIEGKICLMASPSTNHQRILGAVYAELRGYLKGKACESFAAPLDVVLFEKNKKNECRNVFQPDVFVVCDPKKISENNINGAPDFVVEIVSPANPENDYFYKLNAYMTYGVREYWIVNPETKQILVYTKLKNKEIRLFSHTFEDKIKAGIFEGFEMDFGEFL
ncbi:MAG: Uma2 family endonuclease [Oscillospiraceae bacterium]|nr:Uma2 family endonuclease [Oscillospiraceae bacterium]